MKKLLLMALCCTCVHSVYAGTCENRLLEFRGTQERADDEFLYEGSHGFGFNTGYECDNEFCEDGTTITMFPGHFWKGEQINETTTYKCNIGLADKWEPVSNDMSGEIIADRWCNKDTKNGEVTFISRWEVGFDEVKSMAESVHADNKSAAAIKATCTQNGWTEPVVTKCFAPYVANDQGNCEYYTTFLDNNLESFGYTGAFYKEHQQSLGVPDDVYQNYRSGDVSIEPVLYDLINQDPVLSGRVERD